MKKVEKVFRIVSIIIIVGCCLLYGGRLIYYYNKLKPEKVDGKIVEYIAQTIKGENGIAYENAGLYINGSDYVFRGDVKSNYVTYSKMLWRIVRINADGSVKLILEDGADTSSFNDADNKFENSTIYDYLNTTFVSKLTEADKYLSNAGICADNIQNVTKMTCDNKLDDIKVGLLNVEEFALSLIDNQSFIKSEDAFWLVNGYDNDKVWVTYENKLTQDSYLEEYDVRPVITLNSKVKIVDGKGTEKAPYEIEV